MRQRSSPRSISCRIASLREIKRAFAQASIAAIIFVSARTPIIGSLPVDGRPRGLFFGQAVFDLFAIYSARQSREQRVVPVIGLPDLMWRQETVTIGHLHRLFAVSVFPFATPPVKTGGGAQTGEPHDQTS
jgi:hypothetical protein